MNEEKDEAVEEYLDDHTEKRMMNQKKIEKQYKKELSEYQTKQNEDESPPEAAKNIAKFKEANT